MLTALVCLGALASCTQDYIAGPMARNITASPDTKKVEAAGETFDVTVTADGAWAASTPEWISVDPANGEGDATVKVTVAPNTEASRTEKVGFYSAVGDVTNISTDLESTPLATVEITQAAGGGSSSGDAEAITIAELLAKGVTTDSYLVTGKITRVVNTTYGNFDITDETGTVYVYGLLNENLEDQVCFTEKGLAMGDEITVLSNDFTEYSGTWEIQRAVYVNHSKSVISLDSDYVFIEKEGGNFDIVATVKGENVNADYTADWITYNGAVKDGDKVTLSFSVAENAGVPRTETVKISTTTAKGETTAVDFNVEQDGSILTKTVAELLDLPDDETMNYRVTGYISKVNNLAKGRFDITDATGTIYAYNTRVAKESDASSDVKTLGIAEGDVVTLIGYKTSFKGTVEIVGYVESFYKVEAVSVADFLAKEVSTDSWYRLTGSVNNIKNTTYGNFDLTDESGSVYVRGVLTGLNGEKKQFSTLGVEEGDVITIVGNRAEFNGTDQVGNAWYVSHEKGAAPDPEPEPENPDATGFTLTYSQLPTKYPEGESSFTQDSYEFYILKVAHYSDGIQMQGKKNAYIANKTEMPSEIKTITVTTFEGKDWVQGNLKVYAGAAEKPEGEALAGTLSEDGKSETFTVPAGCKYFRLVNESKKAVYMDNVRIGF